MLNGVLPHAASGNMQRCVRACMTARVDLFVHSTGIGVRDWDEVKVLFLQGECNPGTGAW
ncbi:hypothetical protein BD311DRAFT_748639 [Dichomitus squalens]|uniref:Uncharacterized protein n=1 Tax=Dichomitus squalens TaxID=114155 RepID=A0A4Q9N2M1_9APHY|nr:hypothetical protein BD311DRAFT_748639 [Dichomitus squalens]